MNLLLDTCTFLWFITKPSFLPEKVFGLIQGDASVYLSVVSVWELMLKREVDRINFPEDTFNYVCSARKKHIIETLALDEGSIKHLSKLPYLHKDPFDRILISQAIEHDLILVTPDKLISQYPIKIFW